MENQEWSFDTLFPDFNSSLTLQSNKNYTTSKCADYYLKIEDDIVFKEKTEKPPYLITKKNSCDFWTKSLEKISSFNNKLRLIDHNSEYVELISSSLDRIRKYSPKIFDYLNKYVPFILVVEKNEAYSLSTPHLFGTIIISESLFFSNEDIDITIVHELAHQELFLVNLVDPLIDEKFLTNLEYSPFQNKERPPMGRLHASHALFRMTEYSINSNNQSFQKIKYDFGEMIKTLYDYELSDMGNEILKTYKTFYNNVYKK